MVLTFIGVLCYTNSPPQAKNLAVCPISDGNEAISQYDSHYLLKLSVLNQSQLVHDKYFRFFPISLKTEQIFMTHPVEDNESLNLKGSYKHSNGLSLNPFLLLNLFFVLLRLLGQNQAN